MPLNESRLLGNAPLSNAPFAPRFLITHLALPAGAALIISHLNICDRVTVSAGTFVAKDIRDPGVYTSVQPLMRHEDWKHNAAHLRHLDALVKRVKILEAKLKDD